MKPDTFDQASTMLELTLNHHAGVLAHVCGLLTRRAFAIDGMLCLPIEDGRRSRLWIRLRDTGRLDNLQYQLAKLHDVHSVRRCAVPHPALAATGAGQANA